MSWKSVSSSTSRDLNTESSSDEQETEPDIDHEAPFEKCDSSRLVSISAQAHSSNEQQCTVKLFEFEENKTILLFSYVRIILLGSTCAFRLCGDNVDKTIKQRHMRLATRKLESIHYFHIYAVADRIDFSHLSKSVIPTQ